MVDSPARHSHAHPPSWSKLAWRWGLLVVAVASGLLSLMAMANWRPALDPSVAGHHGIHTASSDQAGWQRIVRLQPNSPLAAAGAQVGDLVRFDHSSDANFLRVMGVDEDIGLTWRHAESERHLVIKPVSRPDFSQSEALLSWVAGWTSRWTALAIAVLLALRAAEKPAMRALTLSMLAISTWGNYFLPGGSYHDAFDLWIQPWRNLPMLTGFLYFSLRFGSEGCVPWRHRWVRSAFWAQVLLNAVYALDWWAEVNGMITRSVLESLLGHALYVVLDPDFVCSLATAAAFLWSWRHSIGLERERVGWVTLALCLFAGTTALFDLSSLLAHPLPHRYGWLDSMVCLSLLLLAYAVVRHRVFDIGFVMNRLLVFSIASSVVVAARVVADWAARRWLHGAVPEASVTVDAATTLALVLMFVPLQRFVGERVTRIFFRQWEAAAARMRAFIERSPHVSDAGELRRKLLQAIDAFVGGAGSAFYVRQADGYQRVESTLAHGPERIDENDDAALELMRAQAPVMLVELGTTTQASGAALALPITVRGRLGAFVLVGHKPREDLYRPDELELLTSAVRIVGLDLEALRAEELEREHRATQAERPAAVRSPAAARPDPS